jgi:hypothetical protein
MGICCTNFLVEALQSNPSAVEGHEELWRDVMRMIGKFHAIRFSGECKVMARPLQSCELLMIHSGVVSLICSRDALN